MFTHTKENIIRPGIISYTNYKSNMFLFLFESLSGTEHKRFSWSERGTGIDAQIEQLSHQCPMAA